MKKSTLLFIIMVWSSVVYAQHKRFSIGLKSSVGIHGIKPPLFWGNRDESSASIDIGIRRPKINFSSALLLKYALNKGQKVNWTLSIGCGYDYAAMRKEWHFRRGYDPNFVQYLSELRIIHELQSHHLIIPISINIEVFKKVIFSGGLIRTKILSASIDRTAKRSIDLSAGTWMDEEVTWKANEAKGVPNNNFNTPFLTQQMGLEGTIGFGYYLSDNLIVGVDLMANLSSGFIRVYVDSQQPSDFFYASHKAVLSLMFTL